MQPDNAQGLIEEAIRIVAEMSPLETDGLWLEDIAEQVGPLIKEWDISACYLWTKWPERETYFPDTTGQDIGIDAVAIRRSDGEHIAIQCKARKLDTQEFVSDEGRIRDSARNIDTYLGAVDKETVREMLRTLIREVLVGPGAATLRYTIPMQSGEPGKNTMTEDIILG